MPSVKDCHTLVSYYEKLYTEKYGEKPVVNRNTARWDFDSMLRGMKLTEAKELLDFYFLTMGTVHDHALKWFFYNYDQLIVSKQENEVQQKRAERLRQESEERVKEWRARRGDQGTTGN